MANKYFVWKDPNCNGEDIEWIEMNGVDFVDFVRLPENKHRCFIRLGNDICVEADVIVMETTVEKYKDWKSSSNAHNYLSSYEEEIAHLSLDAPIPGDDGLMFADLIAADDDIEERVLHQIMLDHLSEAITHLTSDEREILRMLYEENISIRLLAHEKGIHFSTLTYRVRKIIEKLEKFFVQI